MSKKITYSEHPTQNMPDFCEECGNDIHDGDEVWYAGDGVYICSDECLEDWNC